MSSLPNDSLSPNAGTLVLVVDDVPQNIQVVGTMLRSAGYSIMPATSGAAALARVESKQPDLILLDLMMPGMDGIEVCRRLMADPKTRRIPVIFLTASNEMDHLVKGFEAGAVDYVTKPFNPPELLARVRTHVELRQARERLRELNEEKDEFMGIAAHDLRNPLGAILGYAEMLLEEGAGAALPTPEEWARRQEESLDLARRIHLTADRMLVMVRNLLDANRIERGEWNLQLSPVDAAALLQSVIETQRPRAAAKQQTLEGGLAPGLSPVLADRDALHQVLENLVSNAIKYSPPGCRIWARVKGDGESVRCEIQDEGPGIGPEDQKRLFGKFARLSTKPTGGEQSTGLGLSIVKRMVEAMNGRVWCESEPGRGATFFVQLPVAGSVTPPLS